MGAVVVFGRFYWPCGEYIVFLQCENLQKTTAMKKLLFALLLFVGLQATAQNVQLNICCGRVKKIPVVTGILAVLFILKYIFI